MVSSIQTQQRPPLGKWGCHSVPRITEEAHGVVEGGLYGAMVEDANGEQSRDKTDSGSQASGPEVKMGMPTPTIRMPASSPSSAYSSFLGDNRE